MAKQGGTGIKMDKDGYTNTNTNKKITTIIKNSKKQTKKEKLEKTDKNG